MCVVLFLGVFCSAQTPDLYAAVAYVDKMVLRAEQSQHPLPAHVLDLYALRQQSVVGPLRSKFIRGGVYGREWSKWRAWRRLGHMPALVAQKTLLDALEEVDPDWDDEPMMIWGNV